MGALFSSSMGETFRNNMLAMQKIQVERQLHMQNLMRERAMAMMIARNREMLVWTGSFYALATVALLGRFYATKKKGFIAPIVPLTFAICYQADLAYGGKLVRIRKMAYEILQEESELLSLPAGIPLLADIDLRRERDSTD